MQELRGEAGGRAFETHDHSTNLTSYSLHAGGLEGFLGRGYMKPGDQPRRR